MIGSYLVHLGRLGHHKCSIRGGSESNQSVKCGDTYLLNAVDVYSYSMDCDGMCDTSIRGDTHSLILECINM